MSRAARARSTRGFLSAKSGPEELRAAARALAAANSSLQNEIGAATETTMTPVWQGKVSDRIRDHREEIMNTGVRVIGGNPAVLIAADGHRRVGRGLRTEHWPGFEYGANKEKQTTYRRKSKNGGTHTVTRRTQKGHPPRHRTGRVLGYATRLILPRIAALWTQTVMKKIYDALEEGRP